VRREEVLDQVKKTMGVVPDWLKNLSDPQLEHIWGMTAWFLSDSRLSARDKALVAFGAATANHCPY
jgi:alkylhydroperoxidase/carboxymuconolactone decarboxylase family protein YurZ